MHEVVYQYPNGNNRRVLLKNNSIQEQIMEVIKSGFLKWVSHPENRKKAQTLTGMCF